MQARLSEVQDIPVRLGSEEEEDDEPDTSDTIPSMLGQR